MFALPSMGSNPFCLGSFWGVWGTFFKKSPTKNRVPSKKITSPYFFIETARLAASTIAEGVRP